MREEILKEIKHNKFDIAKICGYVEARSEEEKADDFYPIVYPAMRNAKEREDYKGLNKLLNLYSYPSSPLFDDKKSKAEYLFYWLMSLLDREQYSIALDVSFSYYDAVIEAYGDNSELSATSKRYIAYCYYELGEFNKAVKYAKESYKELVELKGKSDLVTLDVCNIVGMCYLEMQKFKEAKPYFNTCYYELAKKGDADIRYKVDCMQNLVICKFLTGDKKDLLKLANGCYGVQKSLYGEDNRKTQVTKAILGSLGFK